ncbi:hypothetical protein ACTQ65_003420 [Vibrio cholerae]
MKNTIKCKLHHDQFGTIEVDGLYAFCKQYNIPTPHNISKLIKGVRTEVKGWTVVSVESVEEVVTKPLPQTKPYNDKGYSYSAGVITPNDTRIKPFKTIFIGEDAYGLTSYHDHIPDFKADKNSLYKRFIALYTLSFGNYKLGWRSNLQEDTKALIFWENFIDDINKYVSPLQLFRRKADFYNFTLHLKHSLYETALVLYRLEHEEDEE